MGREEGIKLATCTLFTHIPPPTPAQSYATKSKEEVTAELRRLQELLPEALGAGGRAGGMTAAEIQVREGVEESHLSLWGYECRIIDEYPTYWTRCSYYHAQGGIQALRRMLSQMTAQHAAAAADTQGGYLP